MSSLGSRSVLEKCITSIQKSGQYLLAQKNSNGLIGKDFNVFCKVPLALYAAGFEKDARQQLEAIRSVAFQDDEINPIYLLGRKDLHFASCYYGWMALAASRLGDTEISCNFGSRMLDFQDEAFGGFYSVTEPEGRRHACGSHFNLWCRVHSFGRIAVCPQGGGLHNSTSPVAAEHNETVLQDLHER